MKSAALVASLLFLITSETEAVVGSGPCRGKTVDVFVESSYLTSGDFWSDPDAYVKVRHHCLLKKSVFVYNSGANSSLR